MSCLKPWKSSCAGCVYIGLCEDNQDELYEPDQITPEKG